LRGNSSFQEEAACGGGPFISGRGCPGGTVLKNGDHSFWEEAEINSPGGHFVSKYTVQGDILFQNILSGGTVLGGTKFFVTDLCKAHNTGKIKIFRKCKIIIIK